MKMQWRSLSIMMLAILLLGSVVYTYARGGRGFRGGVGSPIGKAVIRGKVVFCENAQQPAGALRRDRALSKAASNLGNEP